MHPSRSNSVQIGPSIAKIFPFRPVGAPSSRSIRPIPSRIPAPGIAGDPARAEAAGSPSGRSGTPSLYIRPGSFLRSSAVSFKDRQLTNAEKMSSATRARASEERTAKPGPEPPAERTGSGRLHHHRFRPPGPAPPGTHARLRSAPGFGRVTGTAMNLNIFF